MLGYVIVGTLVVGGGYLLYKKYQADQAASPINQLKNAAGGAFNEVGKASTSTVSTLGGYVGTVESWF